MCTNGQLDNTDGVFAPYTFRPRFVQGLWAAHDFERDHFLHAGRELNDLNPAAYVRQIGINPQPLRKL